MDADNVVKTIVAILEGASLANFPAEAITHEMCAAAVFSDYLELAEVPPHMITEHMCRIALKKSGRMFQFVPDGLQSYEMCQIAALSPEPCCVSEMPGRYQEQLRAEVAVLRAVEQAEKVRQIQQAREDAERMRERFRAEK